MGKVIEGLDISLYRMNEMSKREQIGIARALLKGITSGRNLANINRIVDREGNRALHLACVYGTLAEVDNLLNRGADPNAQNAKGETPILQFSKVSHQYTDAYVIGVAKRLFASGAALFMRGGYCDQRLIDVFFNTKNALKDGNMSTPQLPSDPKLPDPRVVRASKSTKDCG